jgi:hypothetical protein
MLEALTQGLDSMELKYGVTSDPPGAQFEVTSSSATYRVRFTLDLRGRLCVAVCQLPVFAPPERRAATAELIVRVNYTLSLGSFELDFADGEITFRCGIDVEDGSLSPALVRNLLRPCIAIPEHFIWAFRAVALGNVSPSTALTFGRGSGSSRATPDLAALAGLLGNVNDRLN